MSFEARIIDVDLTKPLRHKVLWPHIEKEEDCNIDIDRREDAFHVGVFDGMRIVAIGSFFQMDTPKRAFSNPYRLRAMASDPEYRGRHAGQSLIEYGIALLRKRGVEALWCDARLTAVGFYERLGFQQIDEVYEIPKIGPHKFMWIELKS